MKTLQLFGLLTSIFVSTASAVSVQDELVVLQDQLYAAIQSTDPDSVEQFTKITDAIALRELFLESAGNTYVIVNKADFSLRVIKKGKQVLYDRAIIGRDKQPTPELSAKITSVVTNPDWTVTPNTALLRIAPRFAKNPSYATAMGYVIYENWSPHARKIDPKTVNWNKFVNSGHVPYKIYQKPGRFNSLGEIKFIVPGTDGIFIHGTPEKGLFKEEVRKYSSGCVRISKTAELADLILNNMTVESIRANMKSGKTRNYKVRNPMAFHIVDWPVVIDNETQKVVFK